MENSGRINKLKYISLWKNSCLYGIILLLCIIFFPARIYAQYFRNLNVADGLPNSTGKCFAQDGQGFIWVGTFNGLARYDGFRFTTYRHAEGDSTTLADSHIESLCYDGQHGLWVGTKKGIDYMSLVDKKIAHSLYLDTKTKKAQRQSKDCNVWKIIKLGGRLWAVQESGQMLYKRNDGSLLWHPFTYLNERIKAIAAYDGNHILVLSEKRLFLVDAHTLKIKSSLAIAPIKNSSICNLYYSQNQRLAFVGLGYGSVGLSFSIQHYIHKGAEHFLIQQVEKPLPYHIKSICDYDDMTLFATDGQGVKCMKNGVFVPNWNPQYDQMAGNAIHSLFVDGFKSLWLGTYREGVCLYSHRFDYFKSFTQANKLLSYNVVSAISVDTAKIYVGTDGGGLDIYDRSTQTTHSLTTSNSGLPGNNVLGLLDDGDLLWMGIYGKGICVMDKRTGQFKSIGLPAADGQAPSLLAMWQIADDHHGHLLFRGNKLYLYDKKTQQVSSLPLKSTEVPKRISISGNYLWIAYPDRLVKMSTLTYRQEYSYPLPQKTAVLSLCAQSERVFMSGQNGILQELNTKDGKWKDLSVGELRNKEIESIQPDSFGNLWLGTDNGLYQYHLERGTVRTYGQEDHLLPCQYLPNAVFHDGKYIYVGSTKGLVMFSPQQFNQRFADAQIFFDEFLVLGSNEHINLWGNQPESLDLAHNENFFTIRFSVPELATPHKIKFRYMLEGLDKEWREVEDVREVSYTNVSPGSYTFLIQATNDDGTWSKKISQLPIHIAHPWYATWWARILWLLIIIGVIYAIFRHYAEKEKMKHVIAQKEQEKQYEIAQKEQEKQFEIARKEQEKEHELAQKELEKEMIKKNNDDKLNFFANITHELRTPMFLITAPLEELLSSAQRPVQVPYSYLRGMYRNAVRLNRLVNSILDLRKMEAGSLKLKVSRRDMVKICKRLSVDYRALCQQKDISFSFETSLESLGADVDVEKMELILSNIVANAYKYTHEGGTVILRLDKVDDNMQLVVSDTGIGIATENLAKVFERYYRVDENCKAVGDGLGLSFVKSLVELYHGNISVESEVGKGSIFTVVIPLLQPEEVKAEMKLPVIEGDLQMDEADELELDEASDVYQSPTATQALLIIDDERETVLLLKRYLGKDYKIFEAGDGEAGLRMAEEEMPDLVICDVMMPKMDGFEFLGKFKEDKKLQHIPVIMFTAKILDEDKVAAFRYGADAYITKPVSLKYLRARIESFLKTKPASLQEASLANVKPGSHVSKEDQKFILRCREIIDDNMHLEEFNVDFMATQLGMSHSALYKKVKAITGKSVVDMIVSSRLFRAVEMFRSGETNMSTVAERCGFCDLHSFRASFKSRMGMSPKQFVQQM